jgi:tRNA dimethylallyltransferase
LKTETKYLIVVAGPTASGKTSLAIALAQYFDTEILSADSRQCYNELNIGVAKPSPKELAMVNHHFINSHSINQPLHAADYEKYGLEILQNIYLKKNIAIACGGTGLYINALLNGLDDIPEIPVEITDHVQKKFEVEGEQYLISALQTADPLFIKKHSAYNPHRYMRALAVKMFTGNSILTYQQKKENQRPFTPILLQTNLERNELYSNINNRVDVMIAEGLEAEAEQLMPYKSTKPLQTIGYKEWWPYFNGEYNLANAIEKIKQHTRNYAKRQVTWFAHQGNFEKVANNPAAIIEQLKNKIT